MRLSECLSRDQVLDSEDAPMHKMVRLIFAGKLLIPDQGNNLRTYAIPDGAVVHAVLSDAPEDLYERLHGRGTNEGENLQGPGSPTGPDAAAGGGQESRPMGGEDMSRELMIGLLLRIPPGLILVGCWAFYWKYPHLYSW